MDLVGLVAVMGAFAVPLYAIKMRYQAKAEQKQLAAGPPQDSPEVKQLSSENKLLRERVENLEAIVCSVDYELNQKVGRLIDEQRLQAAAQVAALPQPKQAAALEAIIASGDTTVAAAREASKAVRKGEDAAAAVKQKAERKGLSGREVADILEAAKATAGSDTLAVLRLIVEGPEALDAKTRRALGLAPAIEAIERKRAGKA